MSSPRANEPEVLTTVEEVVVPVAKTVIAEMTAQTAFASFLTVIMVDLFQRAIELVAKFTIELTWNWKKESEFKERKWRLFDDRSSLMLTRSLFKKFAVNEHRTSTNIKRKYKATPAMLSTLKHPSVVHYIILIIQTMFEFSRKSHIRDQRYL